MTRDEFGLRLVQDCAVAPGAHVLAAVSGGADSMALLCFFLEIRESFPLTVSCAHVEHGIRDEESRGDMAFVRDFCAREGVAFYAASVDAPQYARQHGCGLEDAARRLRYAFLHETAQAAGADAIALAHHAADQAETVLLHAARGCDLRGLQAMRFRSGMLIRPLLGCRPETLRAYLVRRGQDWREDGTNADMRYARNRIRSGVMPQLQLVSPGAADALCRLAEAAQRDEDYFSAQLSALGLDLIRLADGAAMETKKLSGMHSALRGRVLTRMIAQAGVAAQSARTIAQIEAAIDAGAGVVNLTGNARAQVTARYICLTRGEEALPCVPLQMQGETVTPYGRFFVREALPGETGDGRRAQAMERRLLSGAVISARREGDAMVPFGMTEKVKLKKLMIDAGIERALRRSVPVLRSGEDVLWTVGLRPSQLCAEDTQDTRVIVEYEAPERMPLTAESTYENNNQGAEL